MRAKFPAVTSAKDFTVPMKPNEIKAALVLAGVRQAAIAKATGFSGGYVGDVITGNRRSEKIERAIAAAIGKPLREVFAPRETQAA